jgi:hypothetical protein
VGVDVSVLIPWRGGDIQRERVFEYIVSVWAVFSHKYDLEICVGEDDHGAPFNCSRAQNRAFKRATRDILIMVGADTLPDIAVVSTAASCLRDPSPQWVYTRAGHGWVPLFEKTAYYSEESTARILQGANPDDEPFDYELPFCTGPVAVTRDAYVATGGMDERFSGWGYEDAAFRQTLAGLFGAPPAIPATCRCLHHRVDHRIAVSPNEVLMRDYIPLTSAVSTQAYLDQRGSFL